MANRPVATVIGGIRSSMGLVATKVVPQMTFAATRATIAHERDEIHLWELRDVGNI
jgi:hypothetical protein